MQIAFYAPLKAPNHPTPSGDRAMARLLIAALERAGHSVALASTLRSRDGAGDTARQSRLRALGRRCAKRYLRFCARHPERRPSLWFTYHLYYKAPDWLGPTIAQALDIPYVVAEASLAEKRRDGKWRIGHDAAHAAVRAADAVIGLNSSDRAGVLPALAAPTRWHTLKPFIATEAYVGAQRQRAAMRAELASRYALNPAVPWLITVAMMRPGDKLASYRLLAAALARVEGEEWRLLVIGDGEARAEVTAELAALSGRIAWLGELAGAALPSILAAADLFVWPAINEAFGMALLEAAAAGLPVLAGATGGVPDIVVDGTTGRLVAPGDAPAFAAALADLLAAPEERRRMGVAAQRHAIEHHDLAGAAQELDAILRSLREARPS